jgi:hypothetical protein
MAGVAKHFANVPTVNLRGTAWKPADIDATLKAAIDSANAVDPAKASWQIAVKNGSAAKAKALALLAALKAYLIATHGSGAVDLLADFGFVPPKPGKVAAKTKAAAVDKTAATRALRHTMGKKQKKQVKATTAAPSPQPATTASTQPAPAGTKPA